MPINLDSDYITLTASQLLRFVGTLRLPSACVSDATVAGDAAIAVAKLLHQRVKTYSQPNTTATTETRCIHIVRGTSGTIKGFTAGTIVACSGAATITVDLKKNGSSVLASVITLDSANSARVVEDGSISSASVAVGDWLEVVITAPAGGGTLGTGLGVQLVIDEVAL
jgi:hypothetical protein